VAGKWTIYANDPDGGTSTKFVEIKQNGTQLSGRFKGPQQSGGIEGTINEHHIVFRTKTRDGAHIPRKSGRQQDERKIREPRPTRRVASRAHGLIAPANYSPAGTPDDLL
jgi:hypothetical protein